jgi:hypothetical protein
MKMWNAVWKSVVAFGESNKSQSFARSEKEMSGKI